MYCTKINCYHFFVFSDPDGEGGGEGGRGAEDLLPGQADILEQS